MVMGQSGRYLWLILLIALGVVFYRLLLGDALFWGLPSLQFIPWRLEALDLLRAGQLPLWNSLNGAGAPLFANYQTALLYPLSWLTLVLPAPQTMSLTAALHLLIAGIGMRQFAKALGLSMLGQGVSMLAFGLSGYLVARVGTFPMVEAAAWLPWLLWSAARLIERISPRRIGWMAVFTALLLLAGHAQTAWYSLLLTGAFSLFYGLVALPRRPLVLAAILGGMMLGIGIAALQLLATAELLGQSQRAGGVDYDFAFNFSYAPARILNLLSPNIFGTPADGTYITGGAFFEDAVYVGLIPLAAATAAIVGWVSHLRHRDAHTASLRPTPFWVVVILIGFLFALGSHTGIFPFLFDHVPTFDLFQAPVRWHLWTVTGLSVLAGMGVSQWGRDRRTRRWTLRILVALGGAVVLAAIALAFITTTSPGILVLARALIHTGLVGLGACILTLVQPPAQTASYGRWTLLVLLVLVADLVYAAWGLNPTVSAKFYSAQPPAQQGTTAGRIYWSPEALEKVRFQDFLRFDDYRVAVERQAEYRRSLLPDLNILDWVSEFNNFDPLLPAPYADYLHLLADIPSAALLRAGGIGVRGEQDGTMTPLEGDAPRTWLVTSVCWHETPDSLRAALTDANWRPDEQLHMLGDAGCAAPESTSGTALVVRDQGNVVEIDVQAARDSWLVLADTDYPGWSAVVNDTPAPIFRANLGFRAVQVDAGTSVVRFTYQPGWMLPGLLISVVSLLAALLLFRLRAPEN